MGNGKLSAKCEVRNEDAGCQMPEASQNGKLEMASGKVRGTSCRL